MKLSAAFLFAIALFSSLSFATVLWSLPTADAISGKGVLSGGNVIFTSYNGKVYAVNTTTGATSWTYDSGAKVVLEPALADSGTVAVANSNGALSILSAADGSKKAELRSSQAPVSLAAGDGMIFLAFNNAVFAFDTSGSVLWNSTYSSYVGQVSYSEGAIYFTSGSKLYAVDSAGGQTRWASAADDSFLSRPVKYLGAVYVGAIDGRLYSFDSATGRLRWSYPAGGWIMSTPLATSSAIYFGSNDGFFYSVSPAGLLRFRFQAEDGTWAEPVRYDSRGRQVVVFGTNGGKLYGLDAQSGEERWAFSSYGKPTSAIMDGSSVIFGTSSGRIYSLVPSPICSFTYPSSLDTVGNFPLEVEGRASADTGISKVEVRANKGEWIPATGKDAWYAKIDFSRLGSGAVTLECRSRDNTGSTESGEYSYLMLIKSDTAQPQKMYVSSPAEVDPRKSFNISAKDSTGAPLRRLVFSIGGNNTTSDSPLAVTLGKSGIVPIAIYKPGFEPVSFTISGRGGNEAVLIGGAAALVLAMLALLYFFVIRKMLGRKK
ncbi:Outer membrane protein assembly factor BamB [uncultured archaeon]|nr:Outer membrane protein assembly factor BamB [uncultured archaeon]